MRPSLLNFSFAFASALTSTAAATQKITYEDRLLPILRNECASCHNPDKKKAGLDVSSYQALMSGSDSGKVVSAGDADDSLLYKVVAHLSDPNMPKGKAKLADKDIEVFKAWIEGGAIENATGKAVIAKGKPKLNLSVAADVGRPRGPVVMPKDLPIEPVVHTDRPGVVMCLAASPWAPLAAIGGQHQVLLYNTQSLELLGVLPFLDGDPYVAAFSHNGSMLLVGGGVAAKSGLVVLFDVASGRRVAQIGDEFDAVIAGDISPDQSTIALGGPGKTLKVYSTADGQLLHAMKKHTDWVTAVGYSPDGVLLASGDRQGGLWVWEARSGNEFYGLSGHKAAITGLCFRGDSNILASSSEDGTVKLWDMQAGRMVKSWSAHGSGVLSVSFTHDGRIVTCGRDRLVRTWKADGGGLLKTEPFNDIALHAVFDGDGNRVVAGDWTGTIRVFDAKTGKPVGELTADPPTISQRLQAAQDSLSAAQAANDKSARELAVARETSDKAALDLQAAKVAMIEAAGDSQKESAARKQVEAQTKLASTEAERLAKIEPIARRTAIQLAEASSQVAKLHAAQCNVTLWKARDDLASSQIQMQKLADAATDAADAAAKINAELAASRKLLAEAPQRIATKRQAIEQAKAAASDAIAAEASARTSLKKCQAMARQSGTLAQSLSDTARQSREPALLDAATKAKASFDALNAAVEHADRTVLARSQAVNEAHTAVETAEAALSADQAATESAPKTIAALEIDAKAAADGIKTGKAAADQFTAKVAAAKARCDVLAAEYKRLTTFATATIR